MPVREKNPLGGIRPNPTEIAEAAVQILRAAKRPLAIVGGGCKCRAMRTQRPLIERFAPCSNCRTPATINGLGRGATTAIRIS